jgi:phosphatidylserine decarboxylase
MMGIHREGHRIIAFTILVLVIFCCLLWLALGLIALYSGILISTLFLVFVLRFFRIPNRKAKDKANKILSPCDGKVVVIEEVHEPEFLKTRCIQISIFMSVWNVHINWFPIGGKIVYQKYHPGKFLLAWEPKSSTLNERTTIAIEKSDGVKVLFRQIAGFLARRIVCYAKQDDDAFQGKEMGFIKFGSRVDVFIPLNSTIKVELGQKVVGTQTVLAALPQKQ